MLSLFTSSIIVLFDVYDYETSFWHSWAHCRHCCRLLIYTYWLSHIGFTQAFIRSQVCPPLDDYKKWFHVPICKYYPHFYLYITDRFQFLSVIIIFVPWRCFVLLIAKEVGINRAQTNYNAYCVAAHRSDAPDDVYIMEMYARNNTNMRCTRFVDWEKNEACFLI